MQARSLPALWIVFILPAIVCQSTLLASYSSFIPCSGIGCGFAIDIEKYPEKLLQEELFSLLISSTFFVLNPVTVISLLKKRRRSVLG